MSPIVQNTAQVMAENNSLLGDVDRNPGRYTILGSGYDSKHLTDKVKGDKYARDPEAYYPYVDPNKNTIPQVEQVKMDRPPTHPTEKEAYYNPSAGYKIISPPKVGKEIPVVLNDLQNTFPSEKNLQSLKTQLKAIDVRENLDDSAITQKGIYYSDPKAYYDPTVKDTNETLSQLKNHINSMESSLNNAAKNNIEAKIGTVKGKYQVQNERNYEAEQRVKFSNENYYTPVRNHMGRDIEFPVGTKFNDNQEAKKNGAPKEEPVPVDVIEHTYEEAEAKTTDENKPNNNGQQRKTSSSNLRSNEHVNKLKK